ncbi:7389_t:CDS:2, partial [Diversispora eburnea]
KQGPRREERLLTPPLSSINLNRHNLPIRHASYDIPHNDLSSSPSQDGGNGNLGISSFRTRATSVGGAQRPQKSKYGQSEDPNMSLLLPPSPSASKFIINNNPQAQNSPTKSSTILNAGPELRSLKMDNYRGTSEVFEDLSKTTDDLIQWLTLLDAGINQLLTKF